MDHIPNYLVIKKFLNVVYGTNSLVLKKIFIFYKPLLY